MSTCATSPGNTGLQNCKPNLGMLNFAVLAPYGHSFATEVAALDVDNWITDINLDSSTRLRPINSFHDTEDNSEETIWNEGQEGARELVREGRNIYRFKLANMSLYNFRKLRTLNSRGRLGIYFVTSNGYILANSSDGVKVEARPVQEVYFEKLAMATTDDMQRVYMTVIMDSTDIYNDNGVEIKPTWVPAAELIGIKDVTLLVSAQTTSSLTVSVKGTSDGVGVEGLTTADFTFLKGTTPVVVTATDAGDGIYTLAYTTTAGAHTLNLKNQPAMTTKFFESVASVAVTLA